MTTYKFSFRMFFFLPDLFFLAAMQEWDPTWRTLLSAKRDEQKPHVIGLWLDHFRLAGDIKRLTVETPLLALPHNFYQKVGR